MDQSTPGGQRTMLRRTERPPTLARGAREQEAPILGSEQLGTFVVSQEGRYVVGGAK